MCNEMCGDNRFEIIAEAKRQLLEYTNIETSPDEMAVIDSFLFRCWQMGWLKSLDKGRNTMQNELKPFCCAGKRKEGAD